MSLAGIDRTLFFFINNTLQLNALDGVMVFITERSYLITLPLFFFLLSKDRKGALKIFLVCVSAFALSDWAGNLLKHIFERQRPFHVLEGVNLLTGASSSFSMPSNHAANAFSFIVPLYFLTKSRLKHAMLAIAVLVAFSRVYVGAHYPSDVFIGAILGAVISICMVGFYSWALKKEGHNAFFIIFLTAITIFRIYYIQRGYLDLSPDEAHYWEWSRRLDISYYSKGPAIAYLIWMGTALFGDNVFGIRVMAVLLSLLSSIIMYKLALSLSYDKKVGVYAGSVMQIIPLFSTYGIIMTIDSPFIFFWLLSLLLFNRSLTSGSLRLWLLTGVSVGLGLLTKYTMAFFYLCAFLFLLSSKDGRRQFRSPAPYLSLLMSLVVFSPVIIWNRMHGWVTFRHTAGQAHIAEGMVFNPGSLIEFLGSQIGVLTPLLFILIIYSLIKLRGHGLLAAPKSQGLAAPMAEGTALWFSMPVLLFFLFKSIQGKVEANWAMTGYLTGLITFSAVFLKGFGSSGNLKKALAVSALLLSLFVTAVAHYPAMLKLNPKMDPTARLRGWKVLADEVSRLKAGMSPPVFIFSDAYQVSSELAFYVEGKPVTYCVNLDRRMNQYDLWPGFDGLIRQNAVFVRIGDSGFPPELKEAFGSYEKRLYAVHDRRGVRLKDYSIFLCYDFKGLKTKGSGEKY